MAEISWIERKTTQKIIEIVKEKHTFMDAIRAKRWKMVGYTLRH